MAAHYTENPVSCDQLLLSNSLVQKQWWWLWLTGSTFRPVCSKGHPFMCMTPLPAKLAGAQCYWSLWIPHPSKHSGLAPRSRQTRVHCLSYSCTQPPRCLWPVGSQHTRADLWHRAFIQQQQQHGKSRFNEPALGKAIGSRFGSYPVHFLKGEEHLPDPRVLCCKHPVWLLSAAQGESSSWLSEELHVGSVSSQTRTGEKEKEEQFLSR